MATIGELVGALESIAPSRYAESWDNVGLLLGDPGEALRSPRVLLTIDLTAAVMDEALRLGVGAIVAYHPPIFSGIKALTPGVPKGELLLRAAREGMAIYSPHTALDAVVGGVNDWLLERCVPGGVGGGGDSGAGAIVARRPISPHQRGGLAKLVFFTPRGTEDRLVDALSAVGAGVIGNYSNCSFQSPGIGTFLGGDDANPTLGSRGVYEKVEEVRVEMVVPLSRAGEAIAVLRAEHSYEEPAFDLVSLEAVGDPAIGSGRVGELASAVSVAELAATVRRNLGVERVRVALPEGAAADKQMIRTLGVCPGSGGSLLGEPGARGIECFITGEMTHHHVLAAVERGTTIILAGHTNTERGYLPKYAERIGAAMGGVEALVSGVDRWPMVEV